MSDHSGRRGRRSAYGAFGVAACALALASSASAARTFGPLPTPGPAGLQDGRAYEQVSPVDKQGSAATGALQTRSTGDGIVFRANGAFADAASNMGSVYYRSERTATGWSTRSITPKTTGRPSQPYDEPAFVGASGDLQRTLLSTTYPFDPEDLPSDASDSAGYQDLYRQEADGSLAWLTRGPAGATDRASDALFWGVSPDGERTLTSTGRPLTPEVPAGSGNQVYEQSGGVQHLISVAPGGGLLPDRVEVASGPTTIAGTRKNNWVNGPSPHPMSDDGQTVYFQSNPSGSSPGQIYVRINALRSDAETRPVGQCSWSQYLGAAADGSRMLFWCLDAASGAAGDPGLALYEYDRASDVVRLLPGTENSFLPEFVAADPELSYIYFAANEQLAPGAGSADNLYVLHDDLITYVGNMPNTGAFAPFATTSADGSVMAFVSASSQDPSANDAGHRQVYVYDAKAGTDGTLTCASCRTDGAPSQGTADFGTNNEATTEFGQEFSIFGFRRPSDSVTADGSHVFFTSTDQVVPDATNGVANAYEYSNGRVSLLSSGKSPYPSISAGASADGRDAFIITHEALVPQDTDGDAADVYDARVGGGIPIEEAPPRCGDADACRSGGPGTTSTPAPGSSNAGTGNVPPPKTTSTVKRSVTLPALKASVRSALAAGRNARVAVRVRGRGTVTVRATARIGRRTVQVASAHKAANTTKVSTVTVRLRLSAAARRQLRKGASLRLTVEARMTGASRSAKRSVVLRASTTKKTSR